jgi:ABC-type transporter Mla MlaB component
VAARRRRAIRATRPQRRGAGAQAAAPLALGPALTIAEVAECWRSMTAMLDAGRAEADGSALATVDTAGLQLLLAGGRVARLRGLTLKLSGGEGLLLAAAATLGLDTALRDVVELTP